MCVVLVATYSANLIAALTVQKISLPFETLDGLAADSQYSILVPESSVQASLFKVSTTIHDNKKYATNVGGAAAFGR